MVAGAETRAAAAQALLAWYARARRDLPWRRRRGPYAIWVSEIMLQQTQVDTVLGYYEDFLARFPDVERLAAAAQDEVLAAWSGLGYYRRARNLHAAARQIAASRVWPETAAQWRLLPGIGEYTAAAISSITAGERVAVLDGNVERVLSRFLASAGDPKRAATRRHLRAAAEGFLVAGHAGEANQGLMELGATLCRPQVPQCGACPLATWCAGRATGEPGRYPTSRRRRKGERVRRQVFVVAEDDRYLLFQRAADARRLAGLWELPWLAEGAEPAALSRKYGGVWAVGAAHGQVRHTITHRRFEIEVREASWRPEEVAEASPAAWFSAAEIDHLATSSLVTKALALARGAVAPTGRKRSA